MRDTPACPHCFALVNQMQQRANAAKGHRRMLHLARDPLVRVAIISCAHAVQTSYLPAEPLPAPPPPLPLIFQYFKYSCACTSTWTLFHTL